MNDGDFWEIAIHTDNPNVPALDDRTAGQFLLKMAAMASFGEPTQISLRFNRNLILEAVTPLGTYSFVLDGDDRVVVEQVL